MALKLDRRYPLVWRTPDSLQLGIDRPLLVIENVTSSQEHLIAALVVGVARSGLDMIASLHAAGPHEVDRLLNKVAPALETLRGEEPAATIVGAGPTADALREMLGSGNPDFVVIVAHHVIDPDLHGRWLREDVPHLPVVYGDSLVRIGPIIEPGAGPCLYCLEPHHTGADAAWPAISAQLWGRSSTIESALVASETASIVARLVRSRLGRGTAGDAVSIELDAATGEQTLREWVRHPKCLCEGLIGARPENATVSVRPSDPIPFSPRRAAKSAALA